MCVEPCLSEESDVKDMHITCLQTADDVMQEHFVDDYAKLQYVNVKVTDQNKLNFKMVSGLCDTGAEISVIRTNMLNDWELPIIGKIKLRGIVGSPVSADLVILNVTLADSKQDGDEYVSIICAVCSDANDDLVLTGQVVDDLFKLQSQVTSVNCLICFLRMMMAMIMIIMMTVIMNYVLLLKCYLKIERQMCVAMPICQMIMCHSIIM